MVKRTKDQINEEKKEINVESINAPRFDYNSVKWSVDESTFPNRSGSRLFGIQEVPKYYPTVEEWKDPYAFIEKIRNEAEPYGGCKIIPPAVYDPPFVLDTNNFRFKTRLQRLNSLEGETRVSANYHEQIVNYQISLGKPSALVKLPHLDKRPIDLYKLRNEVTKRGGVQEVTRLKKWAEIGRVLGFNRKQCTSMSNALKNAYNNFVLPFEVWLTKHKTDSPANGAFGDNVDSDACAVCFEKEGKLLLCDGCDRAFHLHCLNPPLDSVPQSDQWYCTQCVTSVGKDFGFEDGSEYTLAEFQTFCNDFKEKWFPAYYKQNEENSNLVTTSPTLASSNKSLQSEIPTAKGSKASQNNKVTADRTFTVPEQVVEEKFWQLVEDSHETCEVEYGADLHSTQHGSGFISVEDSLSGYQQLGVDDPWNLNVLPVAPQSLFSHVKSDISGMMNPWLYVGMCFSAFCWHNEDHYTYSINYMHCGETKTWYVIPGSHSEAFEEAMKRAVPELFEQQPDLLFHLTTMLSPARLVKENVPVYAIDQRPGQFVITFPKAYHSGFNHGFNFCEAVNFAPPDWLKYGFECVQRYKEFRKQPCFNHDQLVLTVAEEVLKSLRSSGSYDEAKAFQKLEWLSSAVTDIIKRQKLDEEEIRKKAALSVSVVQLDNPEDVQCCYCNCYTFTSYVGCRCTDRVSCVDHIFELCSCDNSSKTLYTIDTDMFNVTTDQRSSIESWSQKLKQYMTDQASPQLEKLKAIRKEGETLRASESSKAEELQTLKDYIDTLESWDTETKKILHSSGSSSKYFPSSNTGQTRRIDRLIELVNYAATIDVAPLPHLDKLKDYLAKLENLESQLTEELLTTTPLDDVHLNQLYKEGLKLKADSDKFNRLVYRINSTAWEEEAQAVLKNPFNLSNYRKLIREAENLGIESTSGTTLHRLIIVEDFGNKQLQYINDLCKGRIQIDYDSIESVLLNIGRHTDFSIEFESNVIDRLEKNFARSNETIREVEKVLDEAYSKDSVIDRPAVSVISHLIPLSKQSSIYSEKFAELQAAYDGCIAWEEQVRKTFMKGRQKSLDTVINETANNVRAIVSSSKQSTGIYCICRRHEEGLMIECDSCHEWYHSACLKIPQSVVHSKNSYICPICNPTSEPNVTYISRRPNLHEVIALMKAGESLKFLPKNYTAIYSIYSCMDSYRKTIQAFCRSKSQLGIDDLPQMKYYLRTLIGLEVLLSEELDFLRTKIELIQTTMPQQRGPVVVKKALFKRKRSISPLYDQITTNSTAPTITFILNNSPPPSNKHTPTSTNDLPDDSFKSTIDNNSQSNKRLRAAFNQNDQSSKPNSSLADSNNSQNKPHLQRKHAYRKHIASPSSSSLSSSAHDTLGHNNVQSPTTPYFSQHKDRPYNNNTNQSAVYSPPSTYKPEPSSLDALASILVSSSSTPTSALLSGPHQSDTKRKLADLDNNSENGNNNNSNDSSSKPRKIIKLTLNPPSKK
ncbi:hypothetical protein BDF20DRAFT_909885 [Mycotypha africana]|uniref:uncharacterized protein n=1 Tax=Mycotypha africana TaxID=64632 RepID=UPI002301CFE9|nr:uncharacterized protein BDF20DRAFT_909885 [Mycotypha africana]KAI8987246.1 hypothetical protein BDF20DRAFT_909885 [Mycotypha africana]